MKNTKYILGAALICAIFLTGNVNAASSFPQSDASMSAYVNVGQSIDIEKVKLVFNEIEEVGDNYIYGKTCIDQDTGGCTTVHIYADTDGWLVAYLKSDEPASRIMLWKTSDLNNPTFSISTTLMEALTNAANKAQVSFASTDVKYYDFKWPNANAMVILLKTQATEGNSIMQFQIPANYTLYEASYYHYIYWYRDGDSSLKIDNTEISNIGFNSGNWIHYNAFATTIYGQYIQTGTLHQINISYTPYSNNYDKGSAGVATVLVYKKA